MQASDSKEYVSLKGESLPLARTLLRAAPSGGDTPQRPVRRTAVYRFKIDPKKLRNRNISAIYIADMCACAH